MDAADGNSRSGLLVELGQLALFALAATAIALVIEGGRFPERRDSDPGQCLPECAPGADRY